MRRLARFAAMICLALVVGACGSEESDTQTSQRKRISPPPSNPVPRIPEKDERVPIEGVTITPYFDENGTKTELAVEKGEIFSFWVVAENDVEPTKAAQFRIRVPEGIKVLGEDPLHERKISLGRWDAGYMMAYECLGPGSYYLCRYTCLVEDGFTGGTIETMKGGSEENRILAFLGFSTCEDVEVPAHPGKATLRLK